MNEAAMLTGRNQWRQLSELFDAALDVPYNVRAAWVSRVCSGLPDLEYELRQLLAAHQLTGVLDGELAFAAEAVEEVKADQMIGPYRILGEAGRGGMGVVYKAHDERLDRFVALKFLSRDLAGSPRAAQHFLNEARAASALEHPNICTVYDVGQSEEGDFFIAMAYCEGETLDARMERGRFAIRECVDIALGIAEGLACAHERGIVHRDVKPSNIVLTSRGDVRILDFGVAKLERHTDQAPNGVVGTLAYASPEQLLCAEVDARADVWSLGVLLYEMLAQRRPFSAPDNGGLSIARSVMNDAPEPLREFRSDVPPEVERAVVKALSRSPADRFRDGREFADALKSVSLILTHPVPDDLPASVTSFVGRDADLARAQSLIQSVRLLTLTGPAGTGKTRLAIELARRVAGDFQDGARFIPLAAATEARQVLVAVAESLNVFSSDTATIRSVIAAIENRQVLLVLDNFEQVAAAATLVADLLRAVAGLKMIVTSRVPLHLTGEHEMPVPPLAVPALELSRDVDAVMGTPAVQLFAERARAANPEFAIDGGNAVAVAEICRRLDGLPLAIELAAARTKFLPVQAIVQRLGSRLDLLQSGARDLPARHQTLRQALAWSYDLLEENQRRVFRRAGVFVNGFTVEALEAVCQSYGDTGAATLDSIFGLVDHSLFSRRDGPDHEPRFHLLETMREYALELLSRSSEEEQARRAHADWFGELAARASDALTGNEQARWLRRLDADHDNIRAALSWSATRGDAVAALRTATNVWRYWTARGCHQEGRAWIERLLTEASSAAADLRAHALNGCGTLAHGSGDLTGARDFLRQALELYRQAGDSHGIGLVLNNLAWVAIEMGDFDDARSLSEEAYQLHQQSRDFRGVAVALNNLGWISNYTSDFAAARAFHERSIASRQEAGDLRGLAFGLSNLAWVEQRAGEFQRCEELIQQARQVLDDVNDDLLGAWALQQRAALEYATGRFADAIASSENAIPVWSRVGNSSGLAFGVFYLSLSLLRVGNIDRAAALLGRMEADPDSMAHRWAAALVLLARSRLAFAQGDSAEAILVCTKAIFCFAVFGDRRSLADAYEWLATIVSEDDPDKAREALIIADGLRQEIGSPVPPCDRPVVERVRKSVAL